jgi:predicted metal-binding membrane protein
MSATVAAPARLTPLRGQLALIGLLLVLALAAWVLTDDRMAGMDSGPGTDLGGLGFYVTAWVVMMAAMMFPSIWPMVGVYANVQRRRRESGQTAPAGATALFVIGYLVVWTAAGLIAYALFEGLRSLSIDAFSWDRGGKYLAGGVLVLAAVYQLTPLKDACLRRCRGPLGFLIESWRDGRIGALRMGFAHGAWCLGCCWALMAALFALGVMSVGWMILIAALIAVEKLAPWQWLATRGVAIILIALGIAVATAPADIPGLTIPGSPDDAMSMESGGMDSGGMDSGGMESGGSGSSGMPEDSPGGMSQDSSGMSSDSSGTSP